MARLVDPNRRGGYGYPAAPESAPIADYYGNEWRPQYPQTSQSQPPPTQVGAPVPPPPSAVAPPIDPPAAPVASRPQGYGFNDPVFSQPSTGVNPHPDYNATDELLALQPSMYERLPSSWIPPAAMGGIGGGIGHVGTIRPEFAREFPLGALTDPNNPAYAQYIDRSTAQPISYGAIPGTTRSDAEVGYKQWLPLPSWGGWAQYGGYENFVRSHPEFADRAPVPVAGVSGTLGIGGYYGAANLPNEYKALAQGGQAPQSTGPAAPQQQQPYMGYGNQGQMGTTDWSPARGRYQQRPQAPRPYLANPNLYDPNMGLGSASPYSRPSYRPTQQSQQRPQGRQQSAFAQPSAQANQGAGGSGFSQRQWQQPASQSQPLVSQGGGRRTWNRSGTYDSYWG